MLWIEYFVVQKSGCDTDENGPVQCRAPPRSLKLNVDAAVFKDLHAIGVGTIIRDEEGKTVWAITNLVDGIVDLLIAIVRSKTLNNLDLVTSWWSLTRLRWFWGSPRLILIWPLLVTFFVLPMLAFMLNLLVSSVDHASRSCNQVAHFLSKSTKGFRCLHV